MMPARQSSSQPLRLGLHIPVTRAFGGVLQCRDRQYYMTIIISGKILLGELGEDGERGKGEGERWKRSH